MENPREDPAGIPYSIEPSQDFIPALDGLRAISVLLVIFSHLGLGDLIPGGFGVTVFFFVSGLLITRQLLAEHSATGTVRLVNFYTRRVLRLYPALLVMVLISGVVFVAVGGKITPGDVLAAVFYYANYHALAGGFDSGLPGIFHPYHILWSLAVEEHYYLVFPLLVALTSRNRVQFLLLQAAIIVAVILWRQHVTTACTPDPLRCLGGNVLDRVTQGTDTRIDSILYGAVLATLLGTRFGPRVVRLLGGWGGLMMGAVLILASFVLRAAEFRASARVTVEGIGLTFGIIALLFGPQFGVLRRALSIRPARLVGRWSYGLYLWHWAVLVCLSPLLPAAMWQGVLVDHGSRTWYLLVAPGVVLASFVAAIASYYGVERPMLALRRRFGSHAAADSATA